MGMGVDDEMSFEEAKEVLARSPVSGQVPIVPAAVDHPWWSSLRLPLTIMAVAFLVNSVAVTSLTVLQVRDENATEQAARERACRDAYTAVVAVAASQTRTAVADGQVAFNEGLLSLLQGVPAVDIDSTALREANERISMATERDQQAVDQRDGWESAGSPLPCPLFQENDDG